MADGPEFLAAVRRSRALHGSRITPRAKTQKEFLNYLKRAADDRHYSFLIIHRESAGIAGVININDVIRGNFQSASLGYYAFSPYARQGLMSAGLRLVLKQAFQNLKLHRLEANIQPNNRASIALVMKCRFVREGFSRHLIKVRGRWKDHERWAILAENFK